MFRLTLLFYPISLLTYSFFFLPHPCIPYNHLTPPHKVRNVLVLLFCFDFIDDNPSARFLQSSLHILKSSLSRVSYFTLSMPFSYILFSLLCPPWLLYFFSIVLFVSVYLFVSIIIIRPSFFPVYSTHSFSLLLSSVLSISPFSVPFAIFPSPNSLSPHLFSLTSFPLFFPSPVFHFTRGVKSRLT